MGDHGVTFVAVALALLAACGGSSDTPVDARPVDATVDSPDAYCPDCGDPVDWDFDEGGEVRVERVTFPSGSGVRGSAFVYKDPGSPSYHDFINQMGTCIDTRLKGTDSSIWPFAQNADAQYLDVGPQVYLLGNGMAPYQVRTTTSTSQLDSLGRAHPLWYVDGAADTDTDAATYISASTSYDVVFPGSSEFPGTIFDDAIYFPEDFALTTPAFGDPIVLEPATSFTFEWTVANAAPAGVETLSVIAFTGAEGPAVMCIEPNDGAMTVPGASIDIVRAQYPSGGVLVRQTMTHQGRELVDSNGPTGRRIDFIGAWSYEQPFTVN